MWVVKVKRCDASATRALPERLIDESLTITRSTIALSLRRRYDREAQYCDECVCVFVSPRLYLRNYTSDLQQICRSSSGGVVIRYLLPVLWKYIA